LLPAASCAKIAGFQGMTAMDAIVSMFDQILVRVNCKVCGPTEIKVGQLIGKTVFSCHTCGQDMRLDKEPLKSHLAMLVENANSIDAKRKRSGYVVKRPLTGSYRDRA
jgi:hypothetical protein